jgi:hypothetical protein
MSQIGRDHSSKLYASFLLITAPQFAQRCLLAAVRDGPEEDCIFKPP